LHIQIHVLLDYGALPLLPAGFELIAAGSVLGTFYGAVHDGIVVEVKTEDISGRVELYLQDGREVWQRVALVRNSPPGGLFKGIIWWFVSEDGGGSIQ
jgi:hypothetical protein